jgi:hypothetical protein
MEEKPNFYAIIPANIRYADITPNAKLLYGEITALSSKEGFCFATNQYFADLYKVSKVSISKWIKELIDNKFIESEIIYKQGSKEIINRYLRIVYYPIKEKFNTPIKEKFKDNNTSNNNNIYIKEDLFGSKQESPTDFVSWEEQAPQSPQNPKPAKHKFKKPTRDEVILYAIQRGRTDLVDKFFDYYEAGDWSGVKNWKQKFITWEMHNEKPKGNNVKTDNELRAKL